MKTIVKIKPDCNCRNCSYAHVCPYRPNQNGPHKNLTISISARRPLFCKTGAGNHTRSQKFWMGVLASFPSVSPVGGLVAVTPEIGVRGYNPRDFFWKSVCNLVHFWHVLGVIFLLPNLLLRKLVKCHDWHVFNCKSSYFSFFFQRLQYGSHVHWLTIGIITKELLEFITKELKPRF